MSKIVNPKAVNAIVDIPVTLAQFEQYIMQNKFDKDPLLLGQASDGTRYLVYEKKKRRIYKCTDFLFSMGQRGQTPVTLPASNASGVVVVVLSPALDAVANWLPFVSTINDEALALKAYVAKAEILSVTQLRIRVTRQFSNVSLTGATQAQINTPGQSTYEIVVGANHQHTITSDTVTFPESSGHDHQLGAAATATLNNVGEAAITVTVNWLLVHK